MKKSKKINSNLFRNSALKFILGGIAIFAFGIFVGYQLDNSSITSIQGFLFNAVGDATDANATDTNATDANATDSNATDSNATDSNATDSNATSGNAQATDNILYLQTFETGSSSAKAGDRVNVTLGTSGACNSGASIVFKNNSNGVTFTVSVSSIANNPYITIPSNVSAGTYSVTEIMLVGTNSDNSTFSRRWSAVDQNADYFVDFINKSITITAKETTNTGGNTTTQPQTKLVLNSISLKSTETNVSEKVYVDFKTSTSISSMKLTFSSNSGETMVVYVKSLTSNPYFEVPSTTIIGNYSLVSAAISSTSSTIIYSKDGSVSGSEKFDFNSSIVVNDVKQQDTFVYNNEDLTNDIITDLYNAKNTATINVSADTNPIISEELFNAIKGTDKKLIITYNDNQLIFEGNDISSSKSIDVSITASVIQPDTSIGKLVSDGIVLDFASNGDLPGDATVRIKITEEMKSKLGTGKVYVYYYNVQCDDFTEIATEVKPTDDGYYEFNMNHNSEYILVNEKLDDSLLSDGDENVVNFQKSDKVNLLLIGLGIVLIVVVIVIIIIVKKKNKKETPKEVNINTNNNDFN